jgi:hypothetical protein
MIYNDTKTSLLVANQLPEFIRDNPDYSNFTLFLQAYYEWLETSNAANSQISTANSSGQGVTYATKNLLAYKDVDSTIDDFVSYFTNDFLPYFPKDSLISQREAVKVARELYQTKGTPSSYKFLFRVLYNSDFDVFFTKDAVFKPSDGVWYVAKSLKLATVDPIWLNIKNYRLYGETTQSLATIENSVVAGTKTEVFISNIERLFQSGEYVHLIDQYNQPVLNNGQIIRSKVVGQISTINIDKNNRGLTYNIGDPVIVYGGLNTPQGHGATAQVSERTLGAVKDIKVVSGGYGYTANPQSVLLVQGDGVGAEAAIASLNPDPNKTANVTYLPVDSLGLAATTRLDATHYVFLNAHPSSNVQTKLANALDFTSYQTYPIGSVIVSNGGGGFSSVPTVKAESLYQTEYSGAYTEDLSQIGILSPIQIINGGLGYMANDTITFSGGNGYGAHANVITVNANGAITNVAYVYSSNPNEIYPLGGMGYQSTDVVTATVHSANSQATGAQLQVPGILGTGASFTVDVDRAGSITKIQVTDPGEDYVATPNVSLKVQDIIVSNVSILNLPQKGDSIYQGANVNVATYKATVDSVTLLQPYNDPSKTLYNLRVFEYNSNPNPSQKLVVDHTNGQINMVMANNNFDGVYGNYNKYGYKVYGDGSARATAKFLNGLVLSQGQYLNQRGQPSSYSVLQSKDYNNYTYEITVSKEIEKYRSVLLNLLHPAGTNVVGRMVDKVQLSFNSTIEQALYAGRPFYSPYGGIGQSGATATMSSSFGVPSTNIIQFNNIPPSVNLGNVISVGTYINLEGGNGMNVHSRSTHVDYANNKVTVYANTWLTYANVATVTGLVSTNTINITGYTGNYNIINNGNFSNTSYPLIDMIGVGDQIKLDNSSIFTVIGVNYYANNGIIYLDSNLSSNTNANLTIHRTITANSNQLYNQIQLFGPVGATYIPELATENGQTLTTEDGSIILLG